MSREEREGWGREGEAREGKKQRTRIRIPARLQEQIRAVMRLKIIPRVGGKEARLGIRLAPICAQIENLAVQFGSGEVSALQTKKTGKNPNFDTRCDEVQLHRATGKPKNPILPKGATQCYHVELLEKDHS